MLVTSSCGNCGCPAAPNAIVNGNAEARAHSRFSVTQANCQSHMNRAAVNMESAGEGPSKEATMSTIKLDDRFIQNLRTSSSAQGNIVFWMEAQQFRKDVFISSQATVDLEGSASSPLRTNVVASYGTSAALSQRHPNTGTRGFGDHRTSGGTFFARGRHSESWPTCHCGFRAGSLRRLPVGALDGQSRHSDAYCYCPVVMMRNLQ